MKRIERRLLAAIAAILLQVPLAQAGTSLGAESALLGEVAAPVRASLKEQLLIHDPGLHQGVMAHDARSGNDGNRVKLI